MDVVGRVEAHRLEVVAFEQVEDLDHERALRPEADLVDLVAAIGRLDRLLDLGGIGSEIVRGQQATVGLRELADLFADRPAIEIVARRLNRRAATLRLVRAFRVDERAQRRCQLRLPEDVARFRRLAPWEVDAGGGRKLPHCVGTLLNQAGEMFVHRKPVGILDRRGEHVFERLGAEPVERERQRVEERRNRRRENAVGRNAAFLLVALDGHGFGREPAAADGVDLLLLGDVHEHRRLAAEPEHVLLGHGFGEDGRDTGIDGVPPLRQQPLTGLGGQVLSATDDATQSANDGLVGLAVRRFSKRLHAFGRPVASALLPLCRRLLSLGEDQGNERCRQERRREDATTRIPHHARILSVRLDGPLPARVTGTRSERRAASPAAGRCSAPVRTPCPA